MRLKINPQKKENQEILIKGYAPKDMSSPVSLLYIFLRMAHLVVNASTLPLAILYGKINASGLQDFPLWIEVIAGIGAAMWTMIYISLEQYSYPRQLSGALMFTGALSLNAFSGLSLSDFISTYSAYQVFMSAVFAQFLFMTGTFIRYSYLKLKGHPLGKEFDNGYMIILLGVSAGLGLLLYGLGDLIIRQFTNEKSTLILILSACFFMYHSYSDGKVLWKNSILNKNIFVDQAQSQLLYNWKGFVVIAIILSLIASLVITLW